jgi:hypothetical protein
MTVNRGPGVAKNGSVGVTTVEHRLQLAGQYAENAPGVPRSGVLAQATAVLVAARGDMSYDIGPFPAVISRTASEGVYTPTLTGTTNVATDDAPATNSRWDLIYVKQNDVAKGDPDNLAVVGVIKGTAAASPTKPTGSLPAGAMLLAEARIFAGTTATNGGSNTVAQVWRHTATRGAPIPVRNTTERAEITTPALGQKVIRLDVSGAPEEIWDGDEWLREQESALAVTDGYWTITGNLIKTRAGGRTQVTAVLQLVRTTATININVGDSALLLGLIPAGFRPTTNHYFIGTVNNSAGARYAEPQLVIGDAGNGNLIGRSTSGGGVAIGVGYAIFISTSWFI